MKRYGMLIDIGKCNGCYNCFLACKDEYAGNDHLPYSAAQPSTGHHWMAVREEERGTTPKVKVDYIPIPCQQCREPSCMKYAPAGALSRRPDGIVLIDPERSKGMKEIVSLCPHRVIFWNEEKGIPQKCTFCAHLLDQGWKTPRCVEACPTGALLFGDLEDPGSEISKAVKSAATEELHPEYGLKPSVLYAGLPKPFVTGEVVLADHREECAKGVKVTLDDAGKGVTKETDHFGDFEFKGLLPHHKYTLRFSHPGYRAKEIAVNTRLDTNVGEVVLEPAS